MSFYKVQQRTSSGLSDVGEFPTNIVGTMGSAIIERGSNANGEYVKFADGTLQCYNNPSYILDNMEKKGNYYCFNPDMPVAMTGSVFSVKASSASVPGKPIAFTNTTRLSYSKLAIYVRALDIEDVSNLNTTATVSYNWEFVGRWK